MWLSFLQHHTGQQLCAGSCTAQLYAFKNQCKAFSLYPSPFFTCYIHLPFLSDTTRAVPVVISCARAIVTNSTNSLLVHLVSMVTGWQAREEPRGALCKQNIPESVLVKIPKEWNYTSLEARGKEAATQSTHKLGVIFSSQVSFKTF